MCSLLIFFENIRLEIKLDGTNDLAYLAATSATEKDIFVTVTPSGLYYKTITIVIMTIIVTLQIVASLTIVIDDTS
jgi:hypothetical protein